jgi:hypothetical protein
MTYFVAKIVNQLRRLASETRCQDLIEYALMAASSQS